MLRIIISVVTILLISTSCNHVRRNKSFSFSNSDIPHIENGTEGNSGMLQPTELEMDNDSLIDEIEKPREIPEPSFLFSFALIPALKNLRKPIQHQK